MGGGRSTGSSLLPLATTVTILVGVIAIVLVVELVDPTASKIESLGVCQWAKQGSIKEEMQLMWVLKEETLVQGFETESEKENVKEGGSFLCQTKIRLETLAPMEQEGAIPETKMEADGVSLGARQERL